MEKLELLAKEIMHDDSGEPENPDTAPIDLAQWTLDRFRGEPEPTKFLVDGFIPLGIAGTIYSPGGTGKSTLSIDLACRIAIADAIPSKWLDKFDVVTGGKVLYFSAEEPEEVLHKRVRSICDAIATETGTDADELFNLALRNFYPVNVWGTARQLFEVKSNSLEPMPYYWSIYNTLKAGDFKLCVFDTRSRLSGAEGSGNALVSREVSFYEKLSADFGCTVLILHHTGKASYSGEGNAQAAQRGESAFLDCLRLGIHLQTISEDCAGQNGIPSEDRFKYLTVTQAKSNYTVINEPIIICREGWHFALTDLKTKTTKNERTAKQEAADISKICEVVKDNPGLSQRKIIEALSGAIPFHRIRVGLKNAVDTGAIIESTGQGRAKSYSIDESGQE